MAGPDPSLDLTARKRAEEVVRESQELLRLVLATLRVGVAVTDRVGDIVLANAAAKLIWGDTIVSGRQRWVQTKASWHDTGKSILPTVCTTSGSLLMVWRVHSSAICSGVRFESHARRPKA